MIEIFQSFVIAYPEWRLVESGYDTYELTYRMPSSDETVNFNPDTAVNSYGVLPNVTKVITAGAYAPFYLPSVRDVVFDGRILTFRVQGQSFVCDGQTGIISVQ
jgi:hypothetical protein